MVYNDCILKLEVIRLQEYILLLGSNQFLRERSYAGGKLLGNYKIWTAIENAKYNYNSYFDFCIDANPSDYNSLKKQIEYYLCNGYKPKAIVPLNDWTLKVANTLNREFDLPYLDERTVELCRNKEKMKERLIKHNVATPKFYKVKENKNLRKVLSSIKYPIIIKPIDFGGSGGVYLAKNEEEGIDFYYKSRDIMNHYANEFNVKENEFLVEEFIDTEDEVSVEVICSKLSCEVITVTEKYLSPRPWFTEMGHMVPSHRNKNQKLRELAINACKALGMNRGIAHVEIKIKENEMFVIEVAARPGGDAIMDLIESSYGINPYSLHIQMYLNNDTINLPHFIPRKTAAIAFLKAKKGLIEKINYPNIQDDIEIKRIQILKKVGDFAENPENWSNRDGLVQFEWFSLPTKKELNHILRADKLSSEIFNGDN